MERKIKSKKKVSSSQKNKIINVDDRLNNQFIKTSEPKISKETLYFDKNMNNSIINKIKLPTKDLEKEMKEKTKEEIKRYICVEENKSNIKNIDHLNNPIGENIKKEKENKNILNKTKKYNLIDTQTGNIEYNSTSYAEENIDDLIHNIDDKDNFFSFSNNHKLINIKSREIFKRNMPITDENFNCEDTHFIGQNEKKCNLEEFNKSLQFLEDIEEFKKKKKKMDDAVLNIGKSNEKNSKEINEKKKEKLCLIEVKKKHLIKLQ